MGQISNDHRTFFPYIGLVLSLGWWLRLKYLQYQDYIGKHLYLNQIFITLFLAVISLHAYGTYQRNKVWGSGATLWEDAAKKSPNNGRALMNYGLSLMSSGKYDETYVYFKRALDMMPYWAYININMGILREAMGFPDEAELYFKNAVRFQPFVPDGYYYYGRWLYKNGKVDEAIAELKKGVEISPGHIELSEFLKSVLEEKGETKEDKLKKIETAAKEHPSANALIELSLTYYRSQMFNECISACQQALALQPNMAIAYNNMCSCYNALNQWDKAVEAGNNALRCDPNFQLAKNNLNWANKNLHK